MLAQRGVEDVLYVGGEGHVAAVFVRREGEDV